MLREGPDVMAWGGIFGRAAASKRTRRMMTGVRMHAQKTPHA